MRTSIVMFVQGLQVTLIIVGCVRTYLLQVHRRVRVCGICSLLLYPLLMRCNVMLKDMM